MKVRDSGMPEREYWESLLDVPTILDRLNVDAGIINAAEVGCGYGTFTLPIAKRIRGILHAFDIEREMIALTRERFAVAGARNVELKLRDVVAEGFGLAAGSMDAVFLFNILHAEQPVALLRASADLVRPDGRVLAVHWRSDLPTPRGPDLSIRPLPAQIADWGRAAGLEPADSIMLPPWHFGVALRRPG